MFDLGIHHVLHVPALDIARNKSFDLFLCLRIAGDLLFDTFFHMGIADDLWDIGRRTSGSLLFGCLWAKSADARRSGVFASGVTWQGPSQCRGRPTSARWTSAWPPTTTPTTSAMD